MLAAGGGGASLTPIPSTHSRAKSRRSQVFTSVSKVIARSTPRPASAMSFWASQTSPCVPRYAVPSSPPKSRAAPYSISS